MTTATIDCNLHRIAIDAPLSLWLVELDGEPQDDDMAILSARELYRAGRFHARRDRNRYLIAHIALRQLIEERVGIAAAQQQFVDGIFGKWHLADARGWQFSLSYADDMALIGLFEGGEIGIDIERDRKIDDARELAVLHFTPDERSVIARLGSPLARNTAFLRGWTRKEAGLKALGAGLNLALTELETGVGEDRVTVDCRLGTVELGSLRPAAGFIAAWARVC